MKIKLITLTAIAALITSSLFAQSVTYTAITDFTTDTFAPATGVTSVDGSSNIALSGPDGSGDAWYYFDNGAVDLSAFTSGGLTLDFTSGAGHAASSGFTIQLANYSANGGNGWFADLSGFSWSDTTTSVSTFSVANNYAGNAATPDFSQVEGFGIFMGGNPAAAQNIDVNITGISVVPEPSTYALIAGFAAFLFVAIRRRK